MLYRITLSYACGGIIADETGIVRTTAPIFKWMIGKTIASCRSWVGTKRGKFEPVV